MQIRKYNPRETQVWYERAFDRNPTFSSWFIIYTQADHKRPSTAFFDVELGQWHDYSNKQIDVPYYWQQILGPVTPRPGAQLTPDDLRLYNYTDIGIINSLDNPKLYEGKDFYRCFVSSTGNLEYWACQETRKYYKLYCD